ncbi:alpha/beta hydrolase [Lactobacillus johnsonii]|uniref:Alpha/beta hydrolase n=1 Tax=Lactobacillus johnsonii TaxID=33959 RepID=A0A9X7Y6W3_LACJH|nr:alpha/beta hydrolase [Lactobacillus johnsonii]
MSRSSIGKLNGSDGRVDNKSYLSGGNSTYRVLKINGKNAQHSKLHENSQVDKALIKFVWNK